MPAISYSNPDHLCPGRTIFVVIIGPAGPFMLYIFGPAGPFMHPDHIFLYRAVRSRLSNRAVGLRCFNYSGFIRNHAIIMQETLLREEYEG